VVPGFCRLAVEAACIAAVRRRRIGRGDPHAEVEALLEQTKKLTSLAALALFDDQDRGGDVLGRLNRFGSQYATAFQEINRGAHRGSARDLPVLIRDSAILARRIEETK
jgi:hypothetical protein